MAGGEGTRLRPLTAHTPKPLCPLLGEPVMGYALQLLKRHGVEDVGVTLWYQPDKVRRAFGRGDAYGVRLRYYEEKTPLGTAGSVKLARKHLNGTFFVLSGDGLTDCDLSAALRFHREKKALATLLLKRVSVPLSYGVVLTDADGKITRFLEKPAWSHAYSDLVNTGIYLLEPEIFDYIPDSGAPDFGKDIFPALLRQGLPLYGLETEGYWCDVGDLRAYVQAQQDLLQGRVSLPHASGIHESAAVDPEAHVEGACLIGAHARVDAGAVVRDAVIGENCVIGAGARVESSCLWDGAQARAGARIWGSVLGRGAVARQGAELGDGCALGDGAAVGAQAALRPGVRIWPHLRLPAGAQATRSMKTGDTCVPVWTALGAECRSPEEVCALCQAYVHTRHPRRVLVAWAGHEAPALLAVGAFSAAGVGALYAGEGTLPMIGALIRQLHADGGLLADHETLRFLGPNGQALTAGQMKAMDDCVLRQDSLPSFESSRRMIPLSGAEEMYLSALLNENGSKPLFSPIALFCGSERLLHLAREALRRLPARDCRYAKKADAFLRPDETAFVLSENGEELAILIGEEQLPPEQKTLLLLSLCFQKSGSLYDLPPVPRAAERIAPLTAPDESAACVFQQTALSDGLAAMLLICGALKKAPLKTYLEGLPETHILSRRVPCRAQDKGRILHALCDQSAWPATLGDGVRFRHPEGVAAIVPDAHLSAVRVTAESANSEFARELCDFYQTRIEKITNWKESVSLP